MYADYERVYTNYLMHHGTKGMKRGVRKVLKKYNSGYNGLISSLNEKNPNYHTMKKMIKKDKVNLNKMTSKKDIKNKAAFDAVKYATIQIAGFNPKLDPVKLNKIMEKDWAKNKVQIVKEMNAHRRIGRAKVASTLALYGGIGVATIGMISKNDNLMNAGLLATIGGSLGSAAAISSANTSKIVRRSQGYANRKDIY